jgi:ribonuclease E
MSNNINKMLIDATHAEETRVVVLRNGRVEEFDFESAARKLLRGNIYLAKVTRVEPSLQAAFVDYGGNRHGFLAFSEIHPDYYQIPVADRQALLEEEAAQEAAEEAEIDAHAERIARRRAARPAREGDNTGGARGGDNFNSHDHGGDGDNARPWSNEDGDQGASFAPSEDHGHEPDLEVPPSSLALRSEPIEEIISESPPPETVGGFEGERVDDVVVHEHAHDHDEGDHGPAEPIHSSFDNDQSPRAHESVGVEALESGHSEDAVEEMPQRPRRRPRSYKIQEVIKRRQVILVQVVKEERGNKGAALTTYLSLAGRYTVLMPNTARGGGISRKITQPGDRKRLKAIANELEVPEGMGLIIRTAGAARTSQEIKRDFEYLLRLWESVRELTLESTAPSLVYEEGNLIKRSIRDLYNKDVEEVVVAGEPAFREAQDFMRMLMPSHAKNVIQYQGAEPLFTRYRMEQQLAAMFSPQVTLKSGGYLVINQTEALVAIDVNSGKSTREYSIEETAHQTNLEAADEIARQLKLRDLAGLVVIDFIDMEEKRNNRSVERRLKDALRFDRARIQLGRISHFGLMEMSRQRLRTGVLEGSTTQCPHCQGTGIIRSIESIALAVIRGLEDALLSGTRMALVATTTSQVALYILNSKRAYITDMEARHGLSITVQGSDKLAGANYTIDKVASSTAEPALRRRSASAVNMEWGFDGENAEDQGGDQVLSEGHSHAHHSHIQEVDQDEGDEFIPRNGSPSRNNVEGEGEGGAGNPRRRRRGRRGRRDDRPMGEGGAPRHGQPAGPRTFDDGFGTADRGGDQSNVRDQHDFGTAEGGGQHYADNDSDDGIAAPGVTGPPRGPEEGGDAEQRAKRGRRRGRRGGRRGGRDRERPLAANDVSGADGDANGADDAAGEQDGYDEAQPSSHVEHAHQDAPTAHREMPERSEAEATVGESVDAAGAGPLAPERAPRARRAPRRDPRSDTPAGEPEAHTPAPHAVTQQPAAGIAPAAPTPEPVAAAVSEPKPRRVSSTSSEPVLERVVVGSAASAAASDAAAGDDTAVKPTRKGWWQRKLGLE